MNTILKNRTKKLFTRTKSAYYSTREKVSKQNINSTLHRSVYPIKDLYNNGMPIGEEESLDLALQECFTIEKNGGRIASAPELVLMRNKGGKHVVWETTYDTFSSEHIGKDSKGVFTNAGGYVIVFAHNTGIPSVQNVLDQNLETTTLEKEVRYDQYYFDQLLSGTTQDGLSIDLHHIDNYKGGYQTGAYGLVMPISQSEIDRRKKLVFAKGINENYPEQSYYFSPIAKGRSGLDTDNIRNYVENCLIETNNKPYFFNYFDYNLPPQGQAEVRIINVTGLGFQINNLNNPHNFYGIRQGDIRE